MGVKSLNCIEFCLRFSVSRFSFAINEILILKTQQKAIKYQDKRNKSHPNVVSLTWRHECQNKKKRNDSAVD